MGRGGLLVGVLARVGERVEREGGGREWGRENSYCQLLSLDRIRTSRPIGRLDRNPRLEDWPPGSGTTRMEKLIYLSSPSLLSLSLLLYMYTKRTCLSQFPPTPPPSLTHSTRIHMYYKQVDSIRNNNNVSIQVYTHFNRFLLLLGGDTTNINTKRKLF